MKLQAPKFKKNSDYSVFIYTYILYIIECFISYK